MILECQRKLAFLEENIKAFDIFWTKIFAHISILAGLLKGNSTFLNTYQFYMFTWRCYRQTIINYFCFFATGSENETKGINTSFYWSNMIKAIWWLILKIKIILQFYIRKIERGETLSTNLYEENWTWRNFMSFFFEHFWLCLWF